MNITNEKLVTIYRKDGQYGVMYSMALSKKNQNGGYDKGYIPVKFKNGVEVQDRVNIYIKNAWLTFYLDKSKKTVPYIFINEFSTVEQTIEKTKEEVKRTNDPFEEFGNEADLNELDNLQLPF